jgi:hypothetical protein
MNRHPRDLHVAMGGAQHRHQQDRKREKRLNQQSRTVGGTMVGKHTPPVKKSGQPDDAGLGDEAL